MPISHFDVCSDTDHDGTEFPSPAYAKRAGLQLLGGLLAGESIAPVSDRPSLEVTDEAGTILFRLGVQVVEVACDVAA